MTLFVLTRTPDLCAVPVLRVCSRLCSSRRLDRKCLLSAFHRCHWQQRIALGCCQGACGVISWLLQQHQQQHDPAGESLVNTLVNQAQQTALHTAAGEQLAHEQALVAAGCKATISLAVHLHKYIPLSSSSSNTNSALSRLCSLPAVTGRR